MDYKQFLGYVDRIEDLGQQALDLVAELRADPPDEWPRPDMMDVPILGVACDVPTKGGL